MVVAPLRVLRASDPAFLVRPAELSGSELCRRLAWLARLISVSGASTLEPSVIELAHGVPSLHDFSVQVLIQPRGAHAEMSLPFATLTRSTANAGLRTYSVSGSADGMRGVVFSDLSVLAQATYHLQYVARVGDLLAHSVIPRQSNGQNKDSSFLVSVLVTAPRTAWEG